MQFAYAFKLTRDRKDGGYVVTCRDIAEAITQGDSVEHAITEAERRLASSHRGAHRGRSGHPVTLRAQAR